MERGLLWLPLLGIFIWLAWAGWNEYQKVETYQAWAAQFEKSKYDIYAVLGHNQATLTWGQPTRKGPINLDSVSLEAVTHISVQVNGVTIEPGNPLPSAKRPLLVLDLSTNRRVEIPFTDITLAMRWSEFLQKQKAQVQHDGSTAL